MNLSPTEKHYLISALAGALLAGMGAAVDYLAADRPLDWKPFAVAVAGAVILFLRDWLRNNSGAVLEGSAPAVVEAAHVQATIDTLKPEDVVKPPQTPA